MSNSQWNLLLLSVCIAGSLWIGASRVRPEPAASSSSLQAAVAAQAAPLENHPAPDFMLNDLTGKSVHLADLRGQVVLVNVWATWCPPCRAEMPMIQSAYAQYADQGFTVLAINQREDQQLVATYMQENGLTFPALLDVDASVATLYQVRALPSSFFIDKAGVVRAVYRGPMTRSVITGTVEQLLVSDSLQEQ